MKRKILILCCVIAVIVLLSAQTTYYPSAGYRSMYGGDLSPEWRCDRLELHRLKGIRIK